MYKNRSVKALLVTQEGSVVLIKRSNQSSSNRGLFELPGGKVDFGECILEALLREIREEVGVEVVRLINSIQRVHKQRYFLASDGKRVFQQFFYIITLLTNDRKTLENLELSKEHSVGLVVPCEKVRLLKEMNMLTESMLFLIDYLKK